jgi:hypothetical protein
MNVLDPSEKHMANSEFPLPRGWRRPATIGWSNNIISVTGLIATWVRHAFQRHLLQKKAIECYVRTERAIILWQRERLT